MEKTQEQKPIKAENLVDNFVKQWREKNNTEDAVYSAYHYDAMIAFAEYFKEISKSEQVKEMEEEQKGYTESDMRNYASYILNHPVIEPSAWFKIYGKTLKSE